MSLSEDFTSYSCQWQLLVVQVHVSSFPGVPSQPMVMPKPHNKHTNQIVSVVNVIHMCVLSKSTHTQTHTRTGTHTDTTQTRTHKHIHIHYTHTYIQICMHACTHTDTHTNRPEVYLVHR